MLQQGYVVPPVITTVKNVKELLWTNYIYLTLGSYEVTREPRVTPSHRHGWTICCYPSDRSALPKIWQIEGPDEYTLWRASVQRAWISGIEEARATFTTALATLNPRLQRNECSTTASPNRARFQSRPSTVVGQMACEPTMANALSRARRGSRSRSAPSSAAAARGGSMVFRKKVPEDKAVFATT